MLVCFEVIVTCSLAALLHWETGIWGLIVIIGYRIPCCACPFEWNVDLGKEGSSWSEGTEFGWDALRLC